MTRILLYTTQFCGYCRAAKQLLRGKSLEFEEIDVAFDAEKRSQMIERAMDHQGFSVIECLSECVEFFPGAFDPANPRKISDAQLEALTRSLPGKTTLEIAMAETNGSLEPALQTLTALEGIERLERLDQSDGHVRLYVTGEAPMMVAPVATALQAYGITLSDVKIGEPSLEDVFIGLTGRALR